MKLLPAGALVLLAATLWPEPSHAFGPDICLLTTGELANCTPLPEDCPAGDESKACLDEIGSASGAVSDGTEEVGGKRSMLHMDFTFFVAQFIGYSRNNAYYIAAYDDGTDLGRYIPRDVTGKLLADPEECDAGIDSGKCKWITQPMAGLNKVNIATGGVFYHFHAPFNRVIPAPPSNIDGMHPNTDDPDVEQFLSHLRRWADTSYGVDLLCAHGLTDNDTNDRWDYAYGQGCYGSKQGEERLLVGKLNVAAEGAPTESGAISVPYVVRTGAQVLHYTPDGLTIDSTQFNDYVGKKWKYARIGIYLHAYQDRVSHYHCVDDSYMVGPIDGTAAPVAFAEDMSSHQCDQQLHVARHSWEAGVDQSTVPSEDRTMEAGMRGTYDELLSIAVHMGVATDRALDPNQKEAFIQDMLQAMQERDAYKRMMGVAEVGTGKYGLGAMPGY